MVQRSNRIILSFLTSMTYIISVTHFSARVRSLRSNFFSFDMCIRCGFIRPCYLQPTSPLKTTFHGRWKKLIVDFHRGNFGSQLTEETLITFRERISNEFYFTHFLDRNSTRSERYGIALLWKYVFPYPDLYQICSQLRDDIERRYFRNELNE